MTEEMKLINENTRHDSIKFDPEKSTFLIFNTDQFSKDAKMDKYYIKKPFL